MNGQFRSTVKVAVITGHGRIVLAKTPMRRVGGIMEFTGAALPFDGGFSSCSGV